MIMTPYDPLGCPYWLFSDGESLLNESKRRSNAPIESETFDLDIEPQTMRRSNNNSQSLAIVCSIQVNSQAAPDLILYYYYVFLPFKKGRKTGFQDHSTTFKVRKYPKNVHTWQITIQNLNGSELWINNIGFVF